ncbi:MAG TPA: hypothetical protein ENL27_00325 [Candidatus Parcubacteria bacterium]|nr:hypothetical protein [Candidatus Parcubacteria bacterium]
MKIGQRGAIFYIVFAMIIFISSGLLFYFFILPPKVTAVYLQGQNQKKIDLDSPIIIKFNKPIRRKALAYFIDPEAYGEWEFKDSLIKNHLFKSLVFVPAVRLQPDKEYKIAIRNIAPVLNIGLTSAHSFTFRTKNMPPQKPKSALESLKSQPEAANSRPEEKITILDIPLDWQDHPLSCEAASLKMALKEKGVYLSEENIMKEIGYDSTPHKDGVWGDPDKGFVGSLDGRVCVSGYGVHWKAVARGANKWREAEPFSGWNLKKLTKEISLGNPVLVWGFIPVKTLHPCSWQTPDGKLIKTFKETHVRLAIGFIGNSDNPTKIILNDPLAGKLYWPSSFFLNNWKIFNYSGVAIRQTTKNKIF